MRYTDRVQGALKVGPGQSPLCGFLVASPFDGTLQVFDHDGRNLGGPRLDATSGSGWEEAPGRPAAAGRLPGQQVANPAPRGHRRRHRDAGHGRRRG